MTTAICIASGPSLTPDDVNMCRGKGIVYAISDCHRLAPWADVLYSCDGAWWNHHKGVPEFQGERVTLDLGAHNQFGATFIPHSNDITFIDGKAIGTGGNSGFQAIALAVQRGAKKVILLGYDMGFSGGRKSHWFGDHPGALNRQSNYEKWVKNFDRAAPEIKKYARVINCSRNTALNCFERMSLHDAFHA